MIRYNALISPSIDADKRIRGVSGIIPPMVYLIRLPDPEANLAATR